MPKKKKTKQNNIKKNDKTAEYFSILKVNSASINRQGL
jgi:hypothetical protein